MPKPVHKKPANGKPSANGQAGRVRRLSTSSPLDAVETFIRTYILLDDEAEYLVVAAWIMAAHLSDVWYRFPHLAVTSPEKRCGKTTMMQILTLLSPNPQCLSTITPAVAFRLVKQAKDEGGILPTILVDEAQSIERRRSESSEVLCEILNAGIDRDAQVARCGGDNFEVQFFPIYCPKVITKIGGLNEVLADRCLPIRMNRHNYSEVQPFLPDNVKPDADKLKASIKTWAEYNKENIATIYGQGDMFPTVNTRLAQMAHPLQSVLMLADGERLPSLAKYVVAADDKGIESQSPGVRLLAACREIFSEVKSVPTFLATADLITKLGDREEEPWLHYTRGGLINAEALATLLRPYGIRSEPNKARKKRGYYAHRFHKAWTTYYPTENTSNPSNPSALYKERATSLRSLGYTGEDAYNDYLANALWKTIREIVYKKKGNKCKCGKPATQVHHLNYALPVMLGIDIKPLEPVCDKCHTKLHGKEGS